MEYKCYRTTKDCLVYYLKVEQAPINPNTSKYKQKWLHTHTLVFYPRTGNYQEWHCFSARYLTSKIISKDEYAKAVIRIKLEGESIPRALRRSL